jgi:hypothetical protein
MLDDEEPWDDDTEIDPELWLQALLAMTADKDNKEALVREISQKTGQIPEHVERIIDATIGFMVQKTRSN